MILTNCVDGFMISLSVTSMIEFEDELSFAEDSYGHVKRVKAVAEWLALFSRNAHSKQLSILDYGCGVGDYLAVPLALAGYRVTGWDIHQQSIAAAQIKHILPNLSFTSEPIENVLRANSEFDGVICSEVLEHVPNPSEHMMTIRDLLHADGTLIITVPNGYGPKENLQRASRLFSKIGLNQLGSPVIRWLRKLFIHSSSQPTEQSDSGTTLNVESGHIQFFTLRALYSLFEQADFQVVASRGRTLLCGPYADFVLRQVSRIVPQIYKLNCWLGDVFPMIFVSNWMFCLKRR